MNSLPGMPTEWAADYCNPKPIEPPLEIGVSEFQPVAFQDDRPILTRRQRWLRWWGLA